jgi:hypothetical protein
MNDEQPSYPAEILSATERHFQDTGAVVLGTVEATIGDRREIIRFRIDKARSVVRKILFEAAGLAPDSEPEALAGKSVRVVLAPWTGRDGVERLVVRKWLPAEPKPRAAKAATPAVKPAPAWERDEAQKQPPRAPAARVKASVERAGGEEPEMEFPF